MQALERGAPDKPARAGSPRKQEYEYVRHGTLCLIANWDVVVGKIIAPSICETHKNIDFEGHIRRTVESDPEAKGWRFVVDNLNTHKSEALARFVAGLEGATEEELGKAGKRGILLNMRTREKYLSDPTHRVHFIYTPKHCSWLNQIEIWFSILSRKLLRRGNFSSKGDLEKQVRNFIEYFNHVFAKPFKWTYDGKPCSA